MSIKAMDYERKFQHLRLFTAIVVAGSLLLDGFIVLLAFRSVARAEERIYVLSSGKALEAFASSGRENIPVEARDHIKGFHQAFFTLDPDEKVIESNITHALYLADGSAARLYENLKENGYYSGIISGNISQTVAIDSIVLDTRSIPFYFRCYGTERIIRPTSQVTRYLLTEGWLRYTNRSDNNPHGFLIERWSILDNHDIKAEAR